MIHFSRGIIAKLVEVGSFLAAAIFEMRPPRYSGQAALSQGCPVSTVSLNQYYT